MTQKPDRPAPAEAPADTIILNDDAVVRYWTARLGITADELEEAVEAVGDSPDAVTAYLGLG